MANEKEITISPVGGAQADDSSGDMSLEGALEEEQAIDVCSLCEEKMKNPKVLSCLHEFCEACLKKKLEGEKASKPPSGSGMKEDDPVTIKCPSCGQATMIPERGVSGLMSDTVLEDMIESDSSDTKQVSKQNCDLIERILRVRLYGYLVMVNDHDLIPSYKHYMKEMQEV